MSSFREEAAGQKRVVGIHNDVATLFAELSQNLRGAPSNALMAGLFGQAAPRQMKVNVWARLRGQQGQLTIQGVSRQSRCMYLAFPVLTMALWCLQYMKTRHCLHEHALCGWLLPLKALRLYHVYSSGLSYNEPLCKATCLVKASSHRNVICMVSLHWEF